MSGVTKKQGWKHRSEISQSHYNRTQLLINAATGHLRDDRCSEYPMTELSPLGTIPSKGLLAPEFAVV